jgi:hypothetical protein
VPEDGFELLLRHQNAAAAKKDLAVREGQRMGAAARIQAMVRGRSTRLAMREAHGLHRLENAKAVWLEVSVL